MLDRRAFLTGVASLLAALHLPARAALADPELEAERVALIAHVRDRMLGFDLVALAETILEDLGLPGRGRWLAELRALLADRDTARGFASIRELGEDDALMERLRATAREVVGRPAVKLWAVRRAKRAPATPEGRHALVEHVVTRWFGVDLHRLRAHVASYPDDGLAIVYGPVRDYLELSALFLHEPWALFLQAVHGRRASELFLTDADPREGILRVFLDPDVKRVAMVGHGSWTAFALFGWALAPEPALEDLCGRLRHAPKDTLRAASEGMWRLYARRRYARGSLEEAELAQALDALVPGEARAAVRKELVVRHTCGHGRYDVGPSELAWRTLPDDLAERAVVMAGGLSGRLPVHRGGYEDDVAAWLVGKAIRPRERPAFGRCAVATDQDTVGYEGDSWFPDFLERPIPAYAPPYPAWAVGPEDGAAEP